MTGALSVCAEMMKGVKPSQSRWQSAKKDEIGETETILKISSPTFRHQVEIKLAGSRTDFFPTLVGGSFLFVFPPL